jgi:hypothetical protein
MIAIVGVVCLVLLLCIVLILKGSPFLGGPSAAIQKRLHAKDGEHRHEGPRATGLN